MASIVNMPALRTAVHVATRFQWPGDDQADLPQVVPYFSVIGCAAGTLAWLLAVLLNALTNSNVAAVLGAIVISIAYHWATAGRNLESLTTSLEHLSRRPSQPDSLDRYWNICALQVAVVLRAVLIGLLIWCRCGLWMVVAAMLAWTLYGQLLATAATHPTNAKPPRGMQWAWAAAALVAVAIGAILVQFAAGLFAVLLAWLLAATLGQTLPQLLPEAHRNAGRRACLELAELFFLFYGVLFCNAL